MESPRPLNYQRPDKSKTLSGTYPPRKPTSTPIKRRLDTELQVWEAERRTLEEKQKVEELSAELHHQLDDSAVKLSALDLELR